MVGEPSEWLVNSKIDPFIIKTKLGIEQVNIPWGSVNIKEHKSIAPDFISFFKGGENSEVVQSGRVYEALSKQIRDYNLQAITVECFSLIGHCNSTACLALSKLSMDGIPAGCEGDICSILGMLLVKELVGVVPWMVNVAHASRNQLLLAHCTVPANLLRSFTLDTHFETNKGLAIDGDFKADEVTVFRLDNTLTKAYIGNGRIINSSKHKNACRTQIVLEIDPKDGDYFLNYPLGNHHLVIPGNHSTELELAMRILRMELV
jgi:L-fucose isomerase-like protein